MLENIEVLCHSSIRINRGIVIYIDPFRIDKNYNDANIIFITHDHWDHYSKEDIIKVRNEETVIVAPKDLVNKLVDSGFIVEHIIAVEPGKEYTIDTIKFETIAAYNINKEFHPKENGWVGYIIDIDNIRYYIAGDTDITEENKKVKCDVAFIPVGGTYTMDFREAADLVNIIKPTIAVPTHYGSVVGSNEDGDKFLNLISSDIIGENLLECIK